MASLVRDQYEAFPDPSPRSVPLVQNSSTRVDDNLHFSWSWHRYQYCFRRNQAIRALDVGCGTGVSTLGLARLNPDAQVLGIDFSRRSLAIARDRVAAAGVGGVELLEHDILSPLPRERGTYDFVVCRGVIGQVEDPLLVLQNLRRSLDDRGLLYVTFPATPGRLPIRQMRNAADALAPANATLDERARLALDLFSLLRPDHPIRRDWASASGTAIPTVEAFIARYFNVSERDFTFTEATSLLERAGFQFLFAPTLWPWQAGRALSGQDVPQNFREAVDRLDPKAVATLIDALDPALYGTEYRIYACHADFEPRLPSWPENEAGSADWFETLIPHPTGLVAPVSSSSVLAAGRVAYRSVNGASTDIEGVADLTVRAVDGRRTCAEIDRMVARQTGVVEDWPNRGNRWLELANRAFVILESTDAREHSHCTHLGPIVDRLDCACPRRWVRRCERHGYCTLVTVGPESPTFASLQNALAQRQVGATISCATCVDYDPEDE